MKIEVHLQGGLRKIIDITPGATVGATIGRNVFNADGTLYVPPSSGGSSQLSITSWELILNIPPNVTALANTATTGLYVVTGSGTSATRAIDGPASVVVSDGNGVAGNPSIELDGDDPDPGGLYSYATDQSGAKGWHRPALFESTGLLAWEAPYLSVNGSDPTKFDVGAAVVGYTDYDTNPVAPGRAYAVYGPTTANSVPSLADIATWVGIDTPGLTLVMQNTSFTPTQRRHIVQLGAVISNGTQLIAVNTLPMVMRSGINQISDFMLAVGPINSGNLIGPNGTNLQINKGAGVVFKEGANFANNPDDPHNLPLPALTAANFNYRTSTGIQAATTNAINVTQYESPLGTLATVSNNRFTVQRIYVFTSNLIRIQYGQTEYQTMAEAEAAIATQSFATEANIAENGVLLAFLIVEKNATDLSNTAQAKFIPADKFGGVVGSGGTSITNTDSLPEGVVNLYYTDARSRAAVIAATIVNGDTTHSPSGDAVFDALAVKEPLITPGTTGQFWRGDKAFSSELEGYMEVNQDTAPAGQPGFEVSADASLGATDHANITSTSYGINGGGTFHVRYARGSRESPSQVLSGDIYGGIGGRPYHSGGDFYHSSPVSVHWVAKENQTTSGAGGCLRILTTKVGQPQSNRKVAAVFADDGDLIVGTIDSSPVSTLAGRGLVVAREGGPCEQAQYSYGAGAAFASGIRLMAIGGTISSPTTTVANAGVFFGMGGHDGLSYQVASAGGVFITAPANWSTTSRPTVVTLATTNIGSTTRTNRWQVSFTGSFEPSADNTYDIGWASGRVKEIFAANGTINTSDAREKTEPRDMTAQEISCASDLAALPSIFQWISAVQEKGDSARLHCSPTVQSIISCMEGHGLDPFRYGFVCYDEWEETQEVWHEWPATDEVLDEDGNLIREATEAGRELAQEYRPAGNRYSLRPSELQFFIARGQEERIRRLEALLNP